MNSLTQQILYVQIGSFFFCSVYISPNLLGGPIPCTLPLDPPLVNGCNLKLCIEVQWYTYKLLKKPFKTRIYFCIHLHLFVGFFFSNSYEPELHPGVTYRIKEPKATLKIFSTGSITVTGRFKVYTWRSHKNIHHDMVSESNIPQYFMSLKRGNIIGVSGVEL